MSLQVSDGHMRRSALSSSAIPTLAARKVFPDFILCGSATLRHVSRDATRNAQLGGPLERLA